jgi:nucleoside-diphosphate-sugar epimerase
VRVVVTGATGNVGTSVLDALAADPRVTEIVGLARRLPTVERPRTRWVSADVASTPLEPIFAGADAVVHLAWLIQPARDEARMRAVNVDGSRRVFEAAAAAGVKALVHASSIGVYSPGPKDTPVREDWAREGIASLFYARHKAEAEHILDEVERAAPDMRVVRLRPGLIFKREAAQEIRRYFVGPFLPSPLVRTSFVPAVPDIPRLVVQAVHSRDVAQAYRLAVLEPHARGAYNVAAEPVLDVPELARLLGARPVPMRAGVLRAAADAAFRLRVTPTPAGWLDLALAVPVMDVARAREELGWTPRHDAGEALLELMGGLRETAGGDTPPLLRVNSGPLRVRELLTGVGRRNPPG